MPFSPNAGRGPEPCPADEAVDGGVADADAGLVSTGWVLSAGVVGCDGITTVAAVTLRFGAVTR